MVDMAEQDLTATFAALADPTRRAILARLGEGEATLNDLAGPFPMSLQAISKHLRVLEQAGLITRSGEPAADWLDRYRQFWEASFDQLGEHLRDIQRRDMDQ
jgi:DNA-binding transcriptional ArsR family regulator